MKLVKLNTIVEADNNSQALYRKKVKLEKFMNDFKSAAEKTSYYECIPKINNDNKSGYLIVKSKFSNSLTYTAFYLNQDQTAIKFQLKDFKNNYIQVNPGNNFFEIPINEIVDKKVAVGSDSGVSVKDYGQDYQLNMTKFQPYAQKIAEYMISGIPFTSQTKITEGTFANVFKKIGDKIERSKNDQTNLFNSVFQKIQNKISEELKNNIGSGNQSCKVVAAGSPAKGFNVQITGNSLLTINFDIANDEKDTIKIIGISNALGKKINTRELSVSNLLTKIGKTLDINFSNISIDNLERTKNVPDDEAEKQSGKDFISSLKNQMGDEISKFFPEFNKLTESLDIDRLVSKYNFNKSILEALHAVQQNSDFRLAFEEAKKSANPEQRAALIKYFLIKGLGWSESDLKATFGLSSGSDRFYLSLFDIFIKGASNPKDNGFVQALAEYKASNGNDFKTYYIFEDILENKANTGGSGELELKQYAANFGSTQPQLPNIFSASFMESIKGSPSQYFSAYADSMIKRLKNRGNTKTPYGFNYDDLKTRAENKKSNHSSDLESDTQIDIIISMLGLTTFPDTGDVKKDCLTLFNHLIYSNVESRKFRKYSEFRQLEGLLTGKTVKNDDDIPTEKEVILSPETLKSTNAKEKAKALSLLYQKDSNSLEDRMKQLKVEIDKQITKIFGSNDTNTTT